MYKQSANSIIINKKYENHKKIENIIFEYKYIDDINNLEDNINGNNNIYNQSNKKNKIIHNIADFLTDEYQLITLSKIDFLLEDNINKRYHNNRLKKKKYVKKIRKGGFEINPYFILKGLKDKIVPVPNDMTFNDYIYKFYQYYNMFSIFENKKSILLIKPLSKLNIYNKKVYLYNTIEEYLKSKNIDVKTIFDNYDKINLEENKLKNFEKLKYEIIKNNKLVGNSNLESNKKYDMVYIKFYSINKIKNKLKKEYKSIEKLIDNLNVGFSQLNHDGDLLIELSFLPNTILFKQILYYLTNIFESVEFMKSDLYKNDINSGIFLFKRYNGKYKKIELMINNQFLKSIFSKNMVLPFDFKKYIKDLYKELDKLNEKHMEEFNFFIKELNRSASTWNRFLTNHVVKNSIEWCKKNNIPINSIYNDFEDKLPKELKFALFPVEKGVDLNKVELTYESTFSVTRPQESEKISKIIKTFYPKAKSILDCTANIGGNTINFAKHFKKVEAIEIDPKTCDALKNNVKLYNRDNVKIILGDYTELKDKVKSDVYFFDPPWGGIYYRMHNNLDMFLSGINIIDILPENFVMKAPINYNIEGLMRRFGNIIIYYITNFILIVNLTPKMKIEDTTEIMELLEEYKPLSEEEVAKYEDKQFEGLYDFFNTITEV